MSPPYATAGMPMKLGERPEPADVGGVLFFYTDGTRLGVDGQGDGQGRAAIDQNPGITHTTGEHATHTRLGQRAGMFFEESVR